jgi:hypothetical protein
MDTPVARQPDPQLERVPDDRDVGDATLDGVTVGPDQPAARAASGPLDDEISGRPPWSRRTLGDLGVGTVIISGPGPASPQRHDPSSRGRHALSCTPFPEEPL